MRRCLNGHQKYIDYVNISAQARARSTALEGQLSIGVKVHVISGQTIRDRAIIQEYVKDVFETLNQDFGEKQSESYIFSELYFDKYPLFKDPANRATYLDYVGRAASANIRFLPVGEPKIYHLATYDKTNEDLKYWDQLIKKQTAPAIKPEKYLNLWICLSITSPFLGYAQFPKVNASAEELRTDGVVFFVTIFPFHLYKTVTHELGHWPAGG